MCVATRCIVLFALVLTVCGEFEFYLIRRDSFA